MLYVGSTAIGFVFGFIVSFISSFLYVNGEKIYLNGRKAVKVGETLTKLLSKPTGYYQEVLLFAKNYENRLHYPEDEEEAYNSESFFQEAIKFYAGVEDVIMRLPPYKYLEIVGKTAGYGRTQED
jgi:hypothetical protein